MRTFVLRMLCVALLSGVVMRPTPTRADVGVPDPETSQIDCAQGDCQQVLTILLCPGGDGAPMPTTTVFSVILLDRFSDPLPNHPFQDIWLDGQSRSGPLLRACPGTTWADAKTDVNGYTTLTHDSWHFSGAGAEAHLRVHVDGVLFGPDFFTLTAASPDIDRDGRVDLIDLRLFAEDLLGATPPADPSRSDFDFDGSLDLGDVAKFAVHYGHGCP